MRGVLGVRRSCQTRNIHTGSVLANKPAPEETMTTTRKTPLHQLVGWLRGWMHLVVVLRELA